MTTETDQETARRVSQLTKELNRALEQAHASGLVIQVHVNDAYTLGANRLQIVNIRLSRPL